MQTQNESPPQVSQTVETNASRYRYLFETTPHGIAVVQVDTAVIADVNPSLCSLTGCRRHELIDRKLWETNLFASEEQAQGLLAQLRTTDRLDLGRSGVMRHDGQQRLVETEVACYQEGDHRFAQFSFRDVTERSKIEQRRFLARKMEVMGRVAGKLAHDFNNTLTTILGYSELLLAALGPEDPARADLEQIQKAGQRAAGINQHLLAFRRKPTPSKKLVNVNQVLQEVDLHRKLSLEQIQVEIITDPQIGAIRADRGQIEQVILNLASNARDAMPSGGTLRIETARVELGEASPHIVPVPAGSYVMLAVSDTGPGLDEEQQTNLFEPLFSTKPKGIASGLGLFTTYAIVKLCGGTLDYHSSRGKGSVFQVYFPVAEGVPQPARPETAKKPVESRASATILVVEDEEAVRILVREILRQAGYSILDAPGGTEALRLLETHQRTIDLLLTDVIMPQMNGPALARALESQMPGLRVLYMSGHTDEALLGPQVLQDDLSFIQKPFSPAALVDRVKALLKRPSRKP